MAPAGGELKRGGKMSKTQFYFVLGLLFAVLVAIFALQNTESVDIKFLAWHFTAISKVLVILVSTIVGALVVLFLGFSWQLKRYLYIRRLEGEVESLKKELEQARQTAEPAAGAQETQESRRQEAPADPEDSKGQSPGS